MWNTVQFSYIPCILASSFFFLPFYSGNVSPYGNLFHLVITEAQNNSYNKTNEMH